MSGFRPLDGDACVGDGPSGACCEATRKRVPARTCVYARSASRHLLRSTAQDGGIHLIRGVS